MNGTDESVKALFAKGDFRRVLGVYAAGDNITMIRAVSAAVAAGTKTGAIINKELIDETFKSERRTNNSRVKSTP